MKILILVLLSIILLPSCAKKKDEYAKVILTITRPPKTEKSVWGDTYGGVDEINCLGVLVSYPQERIPSRGICRDINSNVITVPTIAKGTHHFNYGETANYELNLLVADGVKIELVGLKTGLDACPPFTGMDQNMKNQSAPMTILAKERIDIRAGENSVVLNGDFANRVDLEDCNGPLFDWQDPLPAGGLFLGGLFDSINGGGNSAFSNKFAEVGRFNGVVDVTLTATTNGPINAMVLSSSGRKLYIGGSFTLFGGLPRNGLAAYDLETRQVDTTFTASVSGGAGVVNDIKLFFGDTRLLVAGDFDTPRNNLAVYDMIGPPAGWSATITATVPNAVVHSIDIDPSSYKAYIGGEFTTIGGVSRNKIAKIDLLTGDLDMTFNPNVVGTAVYAVKLKPGAPGPLYIGGDFNIVRGVSRNNFASVITSTGTHTAVFNSETAQTNGTIYTFEYDINQDIIYVGGNFTLTSSPSVTRNRIAAFYPNGNLRTNFSPSVIGGGAPSVRSLELSSDGNVLYFGGMFDTVTDTATSYNKFGTAASLTNDGKVIKNFNADTPSNSHSVNSIIYLPPL